MSGDWDERFVAENLNGSGRRRAGRAPSQWPGSGSPPLRPGEPVLIWYDPRDPDDVLIYGRWGRISDRAFVTAGTLLILVGAAIAAFGP